MFNRKEVAAQLSEAAKLLEVLGEDEFRARSWHVAARSFESFGGDIQELHRQGRLTEIRGVGTGTAAELQVMFEEGLLPTLVDLRRRVPDEVKELFAVSGLGAKRIGALWRNGIVGLPGLLAAGESGKLAALPGFGAKSVAKLMEAARFAQNARTRMRLDEADRLAEAVLVAVQGEFPTARVAAAGEYRRGLETISQLEFVVAGVPATDLSGFLVRLLDTVDDDGRSGRLLDRRVRFTATDEDRFGVTLALQTGSDEFVEGLLERARSRGIDLHGRSGSEALRAYEEEDLFEGLDLPWLAPELREGRDPVAVSDLMDLPQVYGLVHNHSTWSDGALSIREMVAAARSLGFSYLAMADHSVSSAVANGLTAERVVAQAAEIRALRDELAGAEPFELLHGMEVDIRPDGTLDFPDELLASLDYVVASVHQNFSLSREEQTERILAAIRNPNVDILGHATGRLLLRRPGYDVDLEQIITACADTGTVIEINANPRRLDLDWRWVVRAREAGCSFSINPDAHTADGFDDLRYGVTMARKAGLTPAHVVNSAPTGREFLLRLGRARP